MKEKHLLKRLPVLIGALALAAGLLAGCSGRGGGKEVSVDLSQAAGDIQKAGGYTEELVELDESTLPASYPKLEMDKVEKYTCRVSGSMATPEEISIFVAKTEDDVASIRAAVDRRVEDQTFNFQDYRPEEMPKLENAVILERGRYVFYAACANPDDVRKVIEGF